MKIKIEYKRELPKFHLYCEKCENNSMVLKSSMHDYTLQETINIYVCENCGFKKGKDK